MQGVYKNLLYAKFIFQTGLRAGKHLELTEFFLSDYPLPNGKFSSRTLSSYSYGLYIQKNPAIKAELFLKQCYITKRLVSLHSANHLYQKACIKYRQRPAAWLLRQ